MASPVPMSTMSKASQEGAPGTDITQNPIVTPPPQAVDTQRSWLNQAPSLPPHLFGDKDQMKHTGHAQDKQASLDPSPSADEASENQVAKAQNTEQSMKEAAEMLNNAAQALKRRRVLVSVDEVPGFVRTVYTLLTVCDPNIISWSEDGTKILIKSSERFAREICPKFFRHRNFNSFTRLLNMYQFHKVPSNRRESKDICFSHPHFQRGREDLLPLVQRKGAQMMREELVVRELLEQSALGGVSSLEKALSPTHPPTILAADVQKQQEMAAACAAAAAAASTDPGTWMQRMNHLESEVKGLKQENDRLKKLEIERDNLRKELRQQGELITALNAQSTILGALNSLASSAPAPTTSPRVTTAPTAIKSSLSQPSQPPDLNELMLQMGGTSAVAVILGMFGNAHNQVLQQQQQQNELNPFEAKRGIDNAGAGGSQFSSSTSAFKKHKTG